MKYILLADVMYDINGGEFSQYVLDVYLGIGDFNSPDNALEVSKQLLEQMAEDEYDVLLCDSEAKAKSIEILEIEQQRNAQ